MLGNATPSLRAGQRGKEHEGPTWAGSGGRRSEGGWENGALSRIWEQLRSRQSSWARRGVLVFALLRAKLGDEGRT